MTFCNSGYLFLRRRKISSYPFYPKPLIFYTIYLPYLWHFATLDSPSSHKREHLPQKFHCSCSSGLRQTCKIKHNVKIVYLFALHTCMHWKNYFETLLSANLIAYLQLSSISDRAMHELKRWSQNITVIWINSKYHSSHLLEYLTVHAGKDKINLLFWEGRTKEHVCIMK